MTTIEKYKENLKQCSSEEEWIELEVFGDEMKLKMDKLENTGCFGEPEVIPTLAYITNHVKICLDNVWLFVGFGIPFALLQEINGDGVISLLVSIIRIAIQLGAGNSMIAALVEHCVLKQKRLDDKKELEKLFSSVNVLLCEEKEAELEAKFSRNRTKTR